MKKTGQGKKRKILGTYNIIAFFLEGERIKCRKKKAVN